MEYDFNNAICLTQIPSESFLVLDNIYNALHKCYLNGESAYARLYGYYFTSDKCRDETDLNNMYLKLFGKSRVKYIKYRLECLEADFINFGVSKGVELSKWMDFVNEFITNIEKYPYVDPVGYLEFYLNLFRKNEDIETILHLIDDLAISDEIMLKGLGILLKKGIYVDKINSILGVSR